MTTTVQNVTTGRIWLPDYGPLDPGQTLDVADDIAEQLCAGGILHPVTPKKKTAKKKTKTSSTSDPSGSSAGDKPEEGTP